MSNEPGVSPATTPPDLAGADADLDEINAFLRRGFGSTLGLEYTEITGDRVHARWEAGPNQHQPSGIVHGGVYCSVIEAMASIGGSVWLGDKGHVVGVNNNTDFLRATREGVLEAEARPVHRGRTQQVWQVDITDAQGRLIAQGKVRLANIADTANIGN